MEENKKTSGVIVPRGIKIIGISLANIMIFILYWLILQFLAGLVIGVVSGIIGWNEAQMDSFMDNNLSIISFATLSIVIAISIWLRKSIYLRLKK